MRPLLAPLAFALVLASCDVDAGRFLSALAVTDGAGCVVRSPAVDAEGHGYCWGGGQALATLRPELGPLARVRLGSPSCLIDEGRVECWGSNEAGELGNGTTTPSELPRQVVSLAGIVDVQVARFVPTTSSGFGPPVPEPGFACALDSDGQLSCWGYNASGQLGDGTYQNRSTPVEPVGLGAVASFALGPRHACAVDVAGALFCWGLNAKGQLGDGTVVTRNAPTPVSLPGPVVSVALGEAHTCAVLDDGAVYCWGDDDQAQLGLGYTGPAEWQPVLVEAVTGAASIAAGARHTCAAVGGGGDAGPATGVLCWGANESAQSGATPNGFPALVPTSVTRLDAVLELSLGRDHSCALLANAAGEPEDVACWGANDRGQSGSTLPTASKDPSIVQGI